MGNSNVRTIRYDDEEHLKKMNTRSKGEKMTRLILESLLNKSFITERPTFLNWNPKTKTEKTEKITNTNKKPKKSNNLEIDLYNEELKIGIEYQGEQHFRYTKHFHKNMEGFNISTEKDQFKRKQCYKNGIYLIEIHDFIKVEDLGEYILKSLPYDLYLQIDSKRIELLKKGEVILLPN